MIVQEHSFKVLKESGMDPNWVAAETQMISEEDAERLQSEWKNSDDEWEDMEEDDEEEEQEDEEEGEPHESDSGRSQSGRSRSQTLVN